MLGPVMSASRTPTLWPALAREAGQQDRDQRLADSSLAAHHGDHPTHVAQLLGRGRFIVSSSEGSHSLPGGERAEMDSHARDSRKAHDLAPDVCLDLTLEGTGGRCEGNGDLDPSVRNLDVLDHPKLHQIALRARGR